MSNLTGEKAQSEASRSAVQANLETKEKELVAALVQIRDSKHGTAAAVEELEGQIRSERKAVQMAEQLKRHAEG